MTVAVGSAIIRKPASPHVHLLGLSHADLRCGRRRTQLVLEQIVKFSGLCARHPILLPRLTPTPLSALLLFPRLHINTGRLTTTEGVLWAVFQFITDLLMFTLPNRKINLKNSMTGVFQRIYINDVYALYFFQLNPMNSHFYVSYSHVAGSS